MSADQYLQQILARERVDTGLLSPVRGVQAKITPILQSWAGNLLESVAPSGSFAKGTANRSGTDIDLFISLSRNTDSTLKEIYESLFSTMQNNGYAPKRQNVSINIGVNGYDVDLIPAKRQDAYSTDHSLYRRKAGTWTKTNVEKHISHVKSHERLQESRIIKLWRNQKRLEFPSFYLELTVIDALKGRRGTLSQNVWTSFGYLRDSFSTARVVDPANSNNIISDDLSNAERARIKGAAELALKAGDWSEIVV